MKDLGERSPKTVHPWRIWLYFASLVLLLIGGWLLFRTPPSSATIGYFGTNPFLCVRPGQLICLRFSKPLPTGVQEVRQHIEKVASKGALSFLHPDNAARGMYWGGVLNISEADQAWIASERVVVLRVGGGIYGLQRLRYPSPRKTKQDDWFEFDVFIVGDSDWDRIIHRQEQLPPDGKIPFVEGNVEVYCVEPSLWMRFRFWLHQELMRRRIDIGL